MMTGSSGVFGFSPEACRVSDTIRQAIVDGHRDRWMAFALEDGSCDGITYERKRDAIRYHANRARKFMYIKVPWDDVSPRAAEVYLKLHRQMTAIGQHVADDEMPDTEWMFDHRREAYPDLDIRQRLWTPPTVGLIRPGGNYDNGRARPYDRHN